MYTQKMFMRPLGVETMLVSIDDERGPQIFKIDPSGHFLGYKVMLYALVNMEHSFNSANRLAHQE